MFDRLNEWTEWIDKVKSTKLFLYSRRTLSPPGTECYVIIYFLFFREWMSSEMFFTVLTLPLQTI